MIEDTINAIDEDATELTDKLEMLAEAEAWIRKHQDMLEFLAEEGYITL